MKKIMKSFVVLVALITSVMSVAYAYAPNISDPNGDGVVIEKDTEQHKHDFEEETVENKYVKKNENEHDLVKYYDKVCKIVGCGVKENDQPLTRVIETENHIYNENNECTKCNYKKIEVECKQHDSEYIPLDDKENGYDKVDDTYHKVTKYYKEKCKICEKVLNEKTTKPGEATTEPHNFVDEKCTLCDYAKQKESKPGTVEFPSIEGITNFDCGMQPKAGMTTTVYAAGVTEVEGDEYTFKVVTSTDIVDLYVKDFITSSKYDEKQIDKSSAKIENDSKVWTFTLNLEVNEEKKLEFQGCDAEDKRSSAGAIVMIEKENDTVPSIAPAMPPERKKVTVVFGEKSVPAFIRENRTLIHTRPILENMGLEIVFEDETKAVIAKDDNHEIIIKNGDDMMMYDGVPVNLDVGAEIYDNKMFIPIRAVAEKFGFDVEWDAATYKVTITNK